MLKKLTAMIAATLLLAACQSDQAAKPPPPEAATNTKMAMNEPKAVQAQSQAKEKDKPEEVEPLAYDEESLLFDSKLSLALRNSEDEFVLETPKGVKLTKIPEKLDKWLSRVKESGGTVKAQALPEPGEMKTRGIFGVLLDVVLYLLGVAKEELTYGPADDYNAMLHFDKKTGEVKHIVFYKK